MARLVPFGLVALLTACGSPAGKPAPTTPSAAPAAKPQTPAPPELELEPLRIRVVRDASGDDDLDVYDARALFDRGNEALTDQRWRDALAIYDEVVAQFPQSKLVGLAHYNAGQALEGMAAWDKAIARYRAAMTTSPTTRDSIDAHLRIGVLLSEQGRWGQAGALFEELLARTDLAPEDRIESMARMGYTLIEQKDYVRAEGVLSEAVEYYTRVARTAELDTNYYVAMSYYYLANIPHRRARAVPLRVTSTSDKELQKDLKAKRDLLGLAYDRYVVALQRRNPYWATAAGYQMSQMFAEFRDDVVTAPIPSNLTPREAGFYRRALHDYMRTFLEKAMIGHTKNVELAEAYRASTEWSRASQNLAQQLADTVAREQRGELVTPDAPAELREPARDAGGRGQGYAPGRWEL